MKTKNSIMFADYNILFAKINTKFSVVSCQFSVYTPTMRPIIKKHIDFAFAEEDPTFKCPAFIMRARLTKWPGNPKYGLIATKKTLKHAVDRNRGKRLLRVWLRENEKYMSEKLDYVFIVRRQILETTKPEGVDLMKRAIKKLKTEN